MLSVKQFKAIILTMRCFDTAILTILICICYVNKWNLSIYLSAKLVSSALCHHECIWVFKFFSNSSQRRRISCKIFFSKPTASYSHKCFSFHILCRPFPLTAIQYTTLFWNTNFNINYAHGHVIVCSHTLCVICTCISWIMCSSILLTE